MPVYSRNSSILSNILVWLGRGGLCVVLALAAGCGAGGGATRSPSSASDTPAPGGGGGGGNCPASVSINMFTENPRTSSGNQTLAFTTTLTTAHTNLATLSGLSGNCSLQSDRYKVTTDSFFPSYIAAPTTTSMKYTPTQPEFRQLNAFYYAMELRNLLVSLGADLSAMGQVSINSHCNVANNAYFSPSSKLLCMGYTDVGSGKKVWASDDGDVVVHEAGHAVNHALSSTSIMNSSGESGAIDEAIADYWALTIMNDGQLAEWFLGALGGGSIRDATQNNSYPASMAY